MAGLSNPQIDEIGQRTDRSGELFDTRKRSVAAPAAYPMAGTREYSAVPQANRDWGSTTRTNRFRNTSSGVRTMNALKIAVLTLALAAGAATAQAGNNGADCHTKTVHGLWDCR
jgi:hypothetical protein